MDASHLGPELGFYKYAPTVGLSRICNCGGFTCLIFLVGKKTVRDVVGILNQR